MDGDEDRSQIVDYYERHYDESVRLGPDGSAIELARTQEIISRYLPKPPANVLDVGGGPGVYAAWLARLGYVVRLVDIVPKHVQQAAARSDSQEDGHFTCELGDATNLSAGDETQDVVLELGPLYHLIEKKQRIKALAEARRVLKPNGYVFAAAITRHTSLLSGLLENLLEENDFRAIVERDLSDGRHLPNTPRFFTEAYFHATEELAQEMSEAGFAVRDILAVEGPLWLLNDLAERWRDDSRRRQLLYALSKIEREPTMMGASLHILAVGQKTKQPNI